MHYDPFIINQTMPNLGLRDGNTIKIIVGLNFINSSGDIGTFQYDRIPLMKVNKLIGNE